MKHLKRKKAKDLRIHANKRLRQRHGMPLCNKLRNTLIKAVQDDEAVFVERQSNRVTVWEYTVDGELLRFVYDKKRKEIVTFLPHDAL